MLTIGIIFVGAQVVVFVFVLALCAAAARGDRLTVIDDSQWLGDFGLGDSGPTLPSHSVPARTARRPPDRAVVATERRVPRIWSAPSRRPA
ncbi:MAG TPA: hypothetical protein VGY97_08100 [Solirubrobacteraceae bacterium]|jgi:hypothetical protein|nr:hypothetical protein [Solirubrobacteraceae bacterium]